MTNIQGVGASSAQADYRKFLSFIKKESNKEIINQKIQAVEDAYNLVKEKRQNLAEAKVELGKVAINLKLRMKEYERKITWDDLTNEIWGANRKRRIDEAICAYEAVKLGASTSIGYSKLHRLGEALSSKNEGRVERAKGIISTNEVLVEGEKKSFEDVSSSELSKALRGNEKTKSIETFSSSSGSLEKIKDRINAYLDNPPDFKNKERLKEKILNNLTKLSSFSSEIHIKLPAVLSHLKTGEFTLPPKPAIKQNSRGID